jgi:hypothetical protein
MLSKEKLVKNKYMGYSDLLSLLSAHVAPCSAVSYVYCLPL